MLKCMGAYLVCQDGGLPQASHLDTRQKGAGEWEIDAKERVAAAACVLNHSSSFVYNSYLGPTLRCLSPIPLNSQMSNRGVHLYQKISDSILCYYYHNKAGSEIIANLFFQVR